MVRTSGSLKKKERRTDERDSPPPSKKGRMDEGEATDSFQNVIPLTVAREVEEEPHAHSETNSADGMRSNDDKEGSFHESEAGKELVHVNGLEAYSDAHVDERYALESVMEEGRGRRLQKKKKKKNPVTESIEMDSGDAVWANSLKGPNLDLMVSLKQLAVERLKNTGDSSLSCCLSAASLRAIGIILEELVKDRMATECLALDRDGEAGNGGPEPHVDEEGSLVQLEKEMDVEMNENGESLHNVIRPLKFVRAKRKKTTERENM